jgi:hypothetical protein
MLVFTLPKKVVVVKRMGNLLVMESSNGLASERMLEVQGEMMLMMEESEPGLLAPGDVERSIACSRSRIGVEMLWMMPSLHIGHSQWG